MTAIALPRTHLPLATYAQYLGIAPPHFMGGDTSTVFQQYGTCEDIWPQHTWQSYDGRLVSREEVAIAIRDAERDIANVLGYPVAPDWIAQELHPYPRHHNRFMTGTNGRDVRNFRHSVNTRWKRVVSPGRRAVEAIDTGASVAYTDEDGDGYSETATVTAATSVTDEREVKVFHAGRSGHPKWEIRPVRSRTISGGTVTVVLDSWLLIDPDTLSAFPTASSFAAIDLSDTSSLVSTVDLYREYNDTSAVTASFLWDPLDPDSCVCDGSGCPACTLTEQDGCMVVRDGMAGIVSAAPATYSDGSWSRTLFSVARDPDQIKFWYRAGNYSGDYLEDLTDDPLDPYLALAIVWLATARLEKPVCSCSNVKSTVEELQRDLTRVPRQSAFYVRFRDQDIFSNPWGTRVGEVRAWQRVHRQIAENMVDSFAF